MTLTDEEIRVKVAELMGVKLYSYQLILCWPDPASSNFWSSGTWDNREAVEREAAAMVANGRVVKEVLEHKNKLPDWLNDERAALQLCDRMRENGCCVLLAGLDHDEGDKVWTVAVFNGGENPIEASSHSLARAICEAFLKIYD